MRTAVMDTAETGFGLEQALATVSRIQTHFHLDPRSPQISALSRALAGGRAVNVAVVGRFKAGKSSFLTEIVRREERVQEILRHKLATLVRDWRDYLAEIRVLTADLRRRAHDTLAEAYSRLIPIALEAVRQDFDRESRLWRGNLARTSEAFQAWADTTLRREMGNVLPLDEQFVAPILAEAEGHFRQAVRAFQDRLAAAVEAALGARVSGATFQAEIEPPCFPDIRVEKTFDVPLDLVWFLVPMPVFRGLVYRRLRSQLPWEVEKNLTRVGWQWTETANRSIESVGSQAEQFMLREAATVVDLAAFTEDRTAQVRAALAELERIATERTNA